MWAPRDWPRTDLLAHRVNATPTYPALVDTDIGHTVTYHDLDVGVQALADQLDALQPEKAEENDRPRVGVLTAIDSEFVRILLAIWRSGGVPVPLAPDDSADRIRHRIEQASVTYLVRAADGQPLPAGDRPVVTVDLSRRPERSGARTGRASWDPDEIALVLFTSGTSGESKGVTLTHRNLVAGAVASAFRLGVTPGDRWLCCLPTHHMGGLAPIVRSILYGTTAVLHSETDPVSLSRTIADADVTGISLVPTLLQRMLDAGWDPPETLRFVLLGGAPARDATLEDCVENGIPVYPTYGTTETASQIATATPAEVSTHPGTVGHPLMFAAVTIRDDGDPVPPGTVGEVVVDGPMVSPGYLDKQATSAAFTEDGFATGDVGYRDESGRLWIRGRLDDAIQTGGKTVHPARVTEVLLGVPSVADAAVVGLADEEWGERVAALVVPGERPLDVNELRELCRSDLARHEVPKTIETAPEVPRTESGTVDRAAVRRLLSS